MADDSVPVVAVDGPAASGKGTIARRVAQALGYHYLDSGALYRLVALKALRDGVDPDAPDGVAALARALDVAFDGDAVRLDGADATDAVRAEDVSAAASRVAVHAPVRAALLARQRAFRRPPGLVADGRDMGTVVFPDAAAKVFVTASAQERAARRQRQLRENGIDVNIQSLLRDIQQRDARDAGRAAAPLRPAEGALLLDTTNMTIDAAVAAVLAAVRAAGAGAGGRSIRG
ncbi:MAG: cytidylate kinase [Betaproteobacteria bacterium]|nr:MAG: cytidylate kinase [Betaproteobacteria bacterium]